MKHNDNYGNRIQQRNTRMGVDEEPTHVEDDEAIVMQEGQVEEESEDEKEVDGDMDVINEPDNESPTNGGFRIRERSDSLADNDEESHVKRQRISALNIRNNARRICNMTNAKSEFRSVNRMLSELEGDNEPIIKEKLEDKMDCTKIMNALLMMES